jgi:hypothetical protein
MRNPKITASGLAFLLATLATGPGSAQNLPWKDACLAIQPTIACKAENRTVIEEALFNCRTAATNRRATSAISPSCGNGRPVRRR